MVFANFLTNVFNNVSVERIYPEDVASIFSHAYILFLVETIDVLMRKIKRLNGLLYVT